MLDSTSSEENSSSDTIELSSENNSEELGSIDEVEDELSFVSEDWLEESSEDSLWELLEKDSSLDETGDVPPQPMSRNAVPIKSGNALFSISSIITHARKNERKQ